MSFPSQAAPRDSQVRAVEQRDRSISKTRDISDVTTEEIHSGTEPRVEGQIEGPEVIVKEAQEGDDAADENNEQEDDNQEDFTVIDNEYPDYNDFYDDNYDYDDDFDDWDTNWDYEYWSSDYQYIYEDR